MPPSFFNTTDSLRYHPWYCDSYLSLSWCSYSGSVCVGSGSWHIDFSFFQLWLKLFAEPMPFLSISVLMNYDPMLASFYFMVTWQSSVIFLFPNITTVQGQRIYTSEVQNGWTRVCNIFRTETHLHSDRWGVVMYTNDYSFNYRRLQ